MKKLIIGDKSKDTAYQALQKEMKERPYENLTHEQLVTLMHGGMREEEVDEKDIKPSTGKGYWLDDSTIQVKKYK